MGTHEPVRDTTPPPAENATRPRVWAPGLIYVTLDGHVSRGQGVGYSSLAPTLRGLSVGYRRSMTNWMHAAWVVERTSLTPDLVADNAIVLPETLIDRDDMPAAHRWLREQPLLCISATDWRRLTSIGIPAYRIAFNVSGEGMLHIDRKGESRESSIVVPLEPLYRAAGLWATSGSLRSIEGAASPVDRLLRMFSDGALTEDGVMNAFDARRVVEYGYGYRGAVEGRFLSVEAVTRRLRPTDLLFSQVFNRANGLLKQAEALDRALGGACESDQQVTVPTYGVARRVVDEPLPVPRLRWLSVDGRSQRNLELPAEVRWHVADVDPWIPRPHAQAVEHVTGEQPRMRLVPSERPSDNSEAGWS